MNRNKSLPARIWWALLPYAGWMGYEEGAIPAPWYAYPLAWLWRFNDWLFSPAPFEPLPEVVCNCDFCRGVPGARFEP